VHTIHTPMHNYTVNSCYKNTRYKNIIRISSYKNLSLPNGFPGIFALTNPVGNSRKAPFELQTAILALLSNKLVIFFIAFASSHPSSL
jgi:hypothetical protein